MQDSARNEKYIVGLTGGIGCGKSTVSNMFRELGADIVDADEISHNLTEKTSSYFHEIVDHFGITLLDSDDNIDRAVLREIVFNNPAEKQWLEELLHPAIRNEIENRLRQTKSAYVILVVPLLLETENYSFVNKVLVVDVPESVQVARIKHRDNIPVDLIQQIIATQISRQERLDKADDILYNDSSPEEVMFHVQQLHKQYLGLGSN